MTERSWLWGLLALVAVGCGADDPKGPSGHFEDESGRSCQVQAGDITCTGEGAVCSAPESSAFVLETLLMSPMRVCAGCRSASGAKSYDSSSCEQVVCHATSDCGYANAACKEGFCWCAPGDC